MRVRPPAVAGRFYPADPGELAATVDSLLAAAAAPAADAVPPRALIVPHAGYIYSGPVAASAYRRLQNGSERWRRVLLLGPAHRVPVSGLALSGADAFATPLGLVPVDTLERDALAEQPGVSVSDRAHRDEHCLEVQLPFLQTVLPGCVILPLLVGQAPPELVAAVVDRYLDRSGWLTLISSDLSHFHDDGTARRLDAATSAAIERLADDELDDQRACGHLGIRGLLQSARRRALRVATVDQRNSGQTGGSADSVVGYGAYVVS